MAARDLLQWDSTSAYLGARCTTPIAANRFRNCARRRMEEEEGEAMEATEALVRVRIVMSELRGASPTRMVEEEGCVRTDKRRLARRRC